MRQPVMVGFQISVRESPLLSPMRGVCSRFCVGFIFYYDDYDAIDGQ
jgi:hypothetical protein